MVDKLLTLTSTDGVTVEEGSLLKWTQYGKCATIRAELFLTCAANTRAYIAKLPYKCYATTGYGQSGGFDNCCFCYTVGDGFAVFTYDHAFKNTAIRTTLPIIIDE